MRDSIRTRGGHHPISRSRRPTHVACSLAAGLVAVAVLLSAQNSLNAKTVTVGTGGGYLNYSTAQTTLNLQPGDTLYIAPGTYSGLSIGNLAGTTAAPITVKCDPNAVFTASTPQTNLFPNISNVTFQDFQYRNYSSRGMQISGSSHDLVFQNYTITNASDYSFYIYDSTKVFNGTKASTFYNFKWDNVTVDGKTNGAAISSEDYGSVSNLKSVLLDFEVSHCTFKNFDNSAQAFPVIGLAKCFGLKVHDSSFSDIGVGASPIGHNVCVSVSGYAEVYNNTFTRQWANEVRTWPMKLNALGYNGPTAVTRFYNNISYEKRKYPMFEQNGVPQADLDQSSGFFSKTASEVYFNTLYRSRKVDYVAPMVDVYSSDITIAHNLIIDPETDAAFNPAYNYVYHLGAGPQTGVVVNNNLVYPTFAPSGLTDAEGFIPLPTSPVVDAATGTVDYITTDHYGNPRYVGGAADVGAVEMVPEPAGATLLAASGAAMLLRRRRQ